MGCGFVKYHLPESGRAEWVCFSVFIHYRLMDDTRLHIWQQPAWCPVCNHFVLAEKIPSVELLDEEIIKFRSGDYDQLQTWAFVSNGSPVAERIAELLRYVKWRQKRQSPPRCLECSTTDPVPIPITGEFPHPQTGERVVVGDSGFTDSAPWYAEFSPEGEMLC